MNWNDFNTSDLTKDNFWEKLYALPCSDVIGVIETGLADESINQMRELASGDIQRLILCNQLAKTAITETHFSQLIKNSEGTAKYGKLSWVEYHGPKHCGAEGDEAYNVTKHMEKEVFLRNLKEQSPGLQAFYCLDILKEGSELNEFVKRQRGWRPTSLDRSHTMYSVITEYAKKTVEEECQQALRDNPLLSSLTQTELVVRNSV